MTQGCKYHNWRMDQVYEKTKAYGMKPVHFNLWEPYTAKGVLTKDLSGYFSEDIAETIIYLVTKKHLKPIDAILEVKKIPTNIAGVLRYGYDLGVTGQFLREHADEYALVSDYFKKTLLDLIHKEKLTLDAALHELQGLSGHEVNILHKFYRQGLRGDVLRELQKSDYYGLLKELYGHLNYHPSQKFIAGMRDWEKREVYYQRYLEGLIDDMRQNGSSWQDTFKAAALDSDYIFKLTNSNLFPKFISENVQNGLRAKDVPSCFGEQQKKDFRVMRWKYHLSPKQAIEQLRGLNRSQLDLIIKYYKQGLNHDVLESYPYSFEFTESLMQHCHWQPIDAVKNIMSLSKTQAYYLYGLAGAGFTFADAQALQCKDEYSEMKKDVILSMVDYGYDLHVALNEVLKLSEKDATEKLKELAATPPLVSMKL